jgi:hypothetical protein
MYRRSASRIAQGTVFVALEVFKMSGLFAARLVRLRPLATNNTSVAVTLARRVSPVESLGDREPFSSV